MGFDHHLQKVSPKPVPLARLVFDFRPGQIFKNAFLILFRNAFAIIRTSAANRFPSW